MKPLLKFTEERIEQMSGFQLHSLDQNSATHLGFYEAIAKQIIGSNAFCDWIQATFEDPSDEELSAQLEFTLERHILMYIRQHFKGLIEDRIYDYLDFQDLRKDPEKYYGVSEKNIVGV